LRRDERPMLLPRRALFDPFREQRNLAFGECFAGRGTVLTPRHAHGGIGRGDARDQLACRRLAWNDGEAPVLQCVLGALLRIEPQRRHLCARPMALEALVRKDRPYVSIELNGGREWLSRGSGRRCLRRRLYGLRQDDTEQEGGRTQPG